MGRGSRARLIAFGFAIACTPAGESESSPTVSSSMAAQTSTNEELQGTDPAPTVVPPTSLVLLEAQVNGLLDQLPADVVLEQFAGWEQIATDTVEIRFTGEIPTAMTGIVSNSELADTIRLEGNAELSLADLQDSVGESLQIVGVVQGAGWYDADLRQHVAEVAFSPEVPKPSAAAVLSGVNRELEAVGLRPLLPHEANFTIYDYVEPRPEPGS